MLKFCLKCLVCAAWPPKKYMLRSTGGIFFYSSIQNKCALSQGRQKLFWVHKLCTPVLVLSQRRKVLQCTTPRDVKVDILLLKVKAKSIQREWHFDKNWMHSNLESTGPTNCFSKFYDCFIGFDFPEKWMPAIGWAGLMFPTKLFGD